THLQLIKDQGVSGDLGGTVKVPQDGTIADGHFAFHLQRGQNTGSADLAIGAIGPFKAIPNVHAEYNQGRGFTTNEVGIFLQDQYTQYLVPSVKFKVTDNVVNVTGKIEAGDGLGVLKQGNAYAQVTYNSGTNDVTIHGEWAFPGNMA